MRIVALDPGDGDAVDQWYDLHVAARQADVPDLPEPSRRDFVVGLTDPWPGAHVTQWVAYDEAGRIVGALAVRLPYLDNTSNAFVEIAVHPHHRQRGVGSALGGHAIGEARKAGRMRVFGDSCEPLPGESATVTAGTAFAVSLGARRALEEVRRRLDLSTVDEEALERLLADARRHATGYSLIRWRDAVPGDVADDLAALDSRLLVDAPTGDLDLEPHNVDADRIHATQRAAAARGRREYHTAIRHDATARVVGWSAVNFDHNAPHHAWQGITIVHPEHRGHRLGILAKLENLTYTRDREPQLREIDTWNAAANDHMTGINELMGFRPADIWVNWQLDL